MYPLLHDSCPMYRYLVCNFLLAPQAEVEVDTAREGVRRNEPIDLTGADDDEVGLDGAPDAAPYDLLVGDVPNKKAARNNFHGGGTTNRLHGIALQSAPASRQPLFQVSGSRSTLRKPIQPSIQGTD